MIRSILRPFFDAFRGLDLLLDGGVAALGRVFLGLAIGWWLYVPVHELLHAAACVAAGGSVSRLEIDVLYGGGFLSRIFPFVVPASDYAGRLSGFDTRGSDLIYLATDLGPFVLALLPGAWLLRRAVSRRRAFLFGLALPMALAPLLSLTGDAYEIGSILATHLPPWTSEAARSLLRGDDLIKKFGELQEASGAPPWGGYALSASLGVAWALATCALGGAIAGGLGERPVPPRSIALSEAPETRGA